ncbi:MAG: SDR family NAD(P)-dependent oxidoreductase [SAR324 cluster bacterium]|nr:SDR family NAD(P)-dependent oxidoreductase [SAR324 cluster bacterium]
MKKKSKVVLLTGCASGIGCHMTRALSQQDFRVIATDINMDALAEKAREEMWSPEKVMLGKLDIRVPSDWEYVLYQAAQKWQQLDIVINNAGYLQPGYIHETSPDEIRKHMDINATGTMIGTQIAAKRMVSQKHGHIINIASLAGIAPVPGLSLYSASKFAVRGFSLAVAQELRPLGVYVTTICPDAVQTPMLDLQKGYEEAALTFSGMKTLTVEDIEKAIMKAIKHHPLEITIPFSRGGISKLVNTFPQLSFPAAPLLKWHGRRKQARNQKQQSS